uniref:Stabilin 1 n=1 Tax=Vombatus ursinus TaxID=29139 RepID=A0A4X2LLZ9_VOMUR
MKTKFLTNPPCTSCAAFKNQVCPPGWSKSWDKGMEECSYTVTLGENNILMSGCSQTCWREVEEKACCPGYWGSECYECPGGASKPCNGHGTCLDGIGQNGTCVCEEGFGGFACQECKDGNSFGPDCKSVCDCVHGVCKNGPQGDGSCLCFAGYTGPRCDQEAPGCKALACPKNSQCVGADTKVPSCKCLPGYRLQGSQCQAQDPCSSFSCSPFASCSALDDGDFECKCKPGYHGDGKFCQPLDPCTSNYGGCPSDTTQCRYVEPGKVTMGSQPGILDEGKAGREGAPPSSPCGDGSRMCVCDEGEIGDGHSCYGHFIRELERLNNRRPNLRKLTTALSMLGNTPPKLTWGPPAEGRSSEKIYKYKDQPGLTYSILQPNLPASNGIFHLVSNIRRQPSSAFIQGDPEKSIGKILASMDVFNRFETILENCGLPSILEGPGPFTVFAPSNDAVDSLRDGRLIYLFTEVSGLGSTHLCFYTLSLQLTVDKLISLKQIQTMANQVVLTNITEEGRIFLGSPGIPLKSVDIVASNGIIHLLDGILLPPSILPILPHRCNEDQYKIVMGTCVDCQAQNTSVCPPNSQELNIFPKECVYIHDPDGLNVMKKGCARYCNQTMNLGCCKGFFGPDCSQCPGGFSNPCYGKGNCSDGIQGNGACVCLKAFKGIACHVCADPNRHGEQCEEECGCVHGICDNRPGSGGVCQRDTCTKGFTGPFCNESSADCGPTGLAQHCHPRARCVTLEGRARCVCPPGFKGDGFSCEVRHPCDQPDRGGCSENAQCIRGVSEPQRCVCNKGWKGDGKVCVAINPCEEETRGSCHVEAHCNYIGPGQSSCTCKPGFAGDGYECSLINPCLTRNGGCHVLVSKMCLRPGGLSLPPWPLGGLGLVRFSDQGRNLENDHFAEFYQWIKRAGFALPTRGNFTALVPSESAIQSLSPEDKAFWLQQQQLLHLLRAHFLPGALTTRQLSGLFGQEVTTLNPPTHWEITNSSGKITIQNVSVAVADILATNGVLHILNKVCSSTPTRASLKDGTSHVCHPLQVPPPVPCSFSQDLETVMRHVLLGEALTPDAMRPGMHRNSLLGSSYELIFYIRPGDLPLVNRVPVVGPTLKPQGGVVLGLGGVLAERPNICPRSHEAAVRVSTGVWGETCSHLEARVEASRAGLIPDCCPGYFGTLCEPCPGGPGGNCSGHGQCQDGLLGNGECRCHEGFHGTACEGCELGRYGLDCAGVCNCGHGMCQDGLLGNGSCRCNVGWKGPHCDQGEGQGCPIKNGGCHAKAECVPTGPSQVSDLKSGGEIPIRVGSWDHPDSDNGGCSPYASCNNTGPGQRTCTCGVTTIGDGFTCRTRISLELLRDKDAAFFSHYFMEYQELKGDGPFTVFVPKEDLMKNFTRRELATFSIHRQLLFRYHTVGCRRLLTQDLLEAGYVTTLSGHKLHFSQHEGRIYINEYAQVVAEDQLGVNGVLHFIDKLLLPPEVVHWTNTSSLPPKQNITEAAERWGYTIFSKLLTTAKMLPMLHDKTHQPFTVLWPTDEALRALSPERQAWLYHEDHREKLAAILRGHVIRNVKALASDIPNLGELRTMHGSPISFSCSKALPGDLLVGEGEARIVQRHMEFLGGIAYGIDQLLEPAGLGSRCDHYTFRQYCGSCVVLPSCPVGYKDEGEVDFCLRESPVRRPFFLRYTPYDPFLFSRKSQKPGCRRRCFTVTWKPACCRGHYGVNCQVCPGGPENPCNGNGVCSDGMTGTGACRCNKGFSGTACEVCAAGAFGPRCQACQCTAHGQCDDGISGSGFCFCNEGWTGQRCEVKLDVQPVCSPPCDLHAVCRKDNVCECNLNYEGDGHKCTVIDHCQNGHGGCNQHATCSQQGVVVTCTCHPDYEGDGVFCRARDRCADGQNGGCSEHAECISTGPNTRRCECRAGYVGNGLQCLVEAVPPEDRCLETPGPCHPEAICTDLHFQEKRAGVFHLQSQEGKYKLTFREAEEQCKAQGAVLASLDQLSAAQQLGFHLCLMGWLSNGTAAYPSVYPSTSCDSNHVGIVIYKAQSNFTEHWDAYCYRVHDVSCQCRDGFVGDGDTVCNGKLLDVLAANANFSTFYGLLLDYANTTQHGLEFLGFLSDELTFKTLFVPVNSGFEDNVTLSWEDLELHASNVTFLSLNLSQSTILPAHSGHQLFISNSSAGNSTVFQVRPLGQPAVSAIVEWDIIAFNGIIHAIESPLTVPPEPAAALARTSTSVAVGMSTALGVGLVLGLVALYFHYKIKGPGFQFHYFKAEDDEDDFSPWQEGPSPPLISVPNPTFDGHDTFYEPFDDSLLEKEFTDTHRILEEE